MIIGGEDRPLKFGVNQSILYCELRNVPINQMDKDIQNFAVGNTSGAEIRDMLWSALKDGARKAGNAFDFTPEDVGDWMEEVNEENFKEFFTEMRNSSPKGTKSSKKK